MTLIYIEDTVKSHVVKLWRRIKSPFSLKNILKNNAIDFNKFREIMAIDLLRLNKSDETKLHDMFKTINSTEAISNSVEISATWDRLISFIDLKTTEKNFDIFKCNIGLESSNISESTFYNIKKLYLKTDCYSLNGRILEAKNTWYLLMDLLERDLPGFTPLPLSPFVGGIPKFPKFIQTGYDKYKYEKPLSLHFSETKINFVGCLYEEARLYYEMGQFDKGDDVWNEINDIVDSRVI